MKNLKRDLQIIASVLMLMALAALPADAQAPPPTQSLPDTPQFTTEQYDRTLAPIALYPDPLLAQILMASTYPLEIVQADRWVQDTNNAALKGDQLTAALEQQPWDPSVKSLVPFPRILRMMDDNLSWTEQLGDAFLAGQPAVMDSVQRLRRKAQANGSLRTSPQQVVATQESAITIEPPTRETVYVPVYNPSVAYGQWPYADYPPYYFPGYFDGAIIGGFGFGWFGFGIDLPLWGWGRWDWGGHGLFIDGGRFNGINGHRGGIASGAWQHDPSHRGGVAYRDAGSRARFQAGSRAIGARSNFRGYPAAMTAQSRLSADVERGATPHSQEERRSNSFQESNSFHATPPAFESFGRGSEVRSQSEQGHASRQSMSHGSSAHGGGGGRRGR
jgi:hypothetical protein